MRPASPRRATISAPHSVWRGSPKLPPTSPLPYPSSRASVSDPTAQHCPAWHVTTGVRQHARAVGSTATAAADEAELGRSRVRSRSRRMGWGGFQRDSSGTRSRSWPKISAAWREQGVVSRREKRGTGCCRLGPEECFCGGSACCGEACLGAVCAASASSQRAVQR